MEIDYARENIKRNVKIIVWILIGISVLGIYQGAGGPRFSFSGRHFSFSGMKGSFFNFTDFPLQTNIIVILSMILGIAVIIYAIRTLQFDEKGRAILSKLLVIDILFQVVSSLTQIIFTLNFARGFHWKVNSTFFISITVLVIFTLSMIVLYYFFYKFLNKPSTKAVF